MFFLKNLIKYTLSPLLLITLSGCSFFGPEQQRTLILGMAADSPPFTFEKDGQYVGFEIDLSQLIAKKINYALEIKDIDFGSLIAALKSGVIDFSASGWMKTSERAKSVDFSNTYYATNLGLLSLEPYYSLHDLKHKTVGVQLGSTWDALLTEKQKEQPTMQIIQGDRVNILAEMLKNGSIDALVLDDSIGIKFAAVDNRLLFRMLEGYASGFHVITAKDSDLTPRINEAIEQLRTSGELAQITEKWFPGKSVIPAQAPIDQPLP